MYFTGMFTDLHIFQNNNLVRAVTHADDDAGKLKASGGFHDFQALEPFALKNLTTYRPDGQVYAATEHNGYVYAACGSAGIHVRGREADAAEEISDSGLRRWTFRFAEISCMPPKVLKGSSATMLTARCFKRVTSYHAELRSGGSREPPLASFTSY